MSTNIQSPFSPGSGVSNPVTIGQGGTGQSTAAAAFTALSPLTTAGDLIIENATPAPARLAVGTASEQMLGVAAGLPAWVTAFCLQAATPAAGYTLVNGTGTIISWTAPNDGLLHRFLLVGNKHVTSNETGGAIQIAWTAPDASSQSQACLPGSSAAGLIKLSNVGNGVFAIQAGTTATLSQSSALTGGASVAWAEIWGA